MKGEFTVTFEREFVQVVSEGDKDFGLATRLWTTAVDVCQEHDCYKVLGIATSSRPITASEAADLAELFDRLHISGDYRIAWVEYNPKAFERVKYAVSVVRGRGFDARLFPNVQQARAWLLNNGEP